MTSFAVATSTTSGDEVDRDTLITVTVDQSNSEFEMFRRAAPASASTSAHGVVSGNSASVASDNDHDNVRDNSRDNDRDSNHDNSRDNAREAAAAHGRCLMCAAVPNVLRSTLLRRVIPAAILTIITVFVLVHDIMFSSSASSAGSGDGSAGILDPIKDEMRRIVIQQLLGRSNTTSTSTP